MRLRIHPMWFILFLILGIALYNLNGNEWSIYLFMGLGIVIMLIFKTTPSQSLGFDKKPIQALMVWAVVLLTVLVMIVDLFV